MLPFGSRIPLGDNGNVNGQLLMGIEGQDTAYFTDWDAAPGNKAIMGFNVIATNALNTAKVTVQTKKAGDDDSAPTAVTTDQSITLTNNTTTTWTSGAEPGSASTGFQDLYRLKIVLNVTGGGGKDGWIFGHVAGVSWSST